MQGDDIGRLQSAFQILPVFTVGLKVARFNVEIGCNSFKLKRVILEFGFNVWKQLIEFYGNGIFSARIQWLVRGKKQRVFVFGFQGSFHVGFYVKNLIGDFLA